MENKSAADQTIKIFIDALMASAAENTEVVQQVIKHLTATANFSSKLIPRMARRMMVERPQLALVISALHGAVECFGFGGVLVLMFKLRFGGKTDAK